MRVVNRDVFLSMPPGTIYCQGERWDFNCLNVKVQNIGENDWCYIDPAWVEGRSSDECYEKLEEMLSTGTSYPMRNSVSRDGCFDEDAIFLIFEKEDLLVFRGWIDDALAVSV